MAFYEYAYIVTLPVRIANFMFSKQQMYRKKNNTSLKFTCHGKPENHISHGEIQNTPR